MVDHELTGGCTRTGFTINMKKMPDGAFIGKLAASIAAFLKEIGADDTGWRRVANFYGYVPSFDSDSFEVVCSISTEAASNWNKVKEYYSKMMSVLSELEEAVKKAEEECMKYKAKLYESGYVYENEWKMYLQQNVAPKLQEIQKYKELYESYLTQVMNNKFDWFCIKQSDPDWKEYTKYYMQALPLPAVCYVDEEGNYVCSIDCELPKIYITDVNFGYNLVEFTAWADVELTVLFDVTLTGAGETEEELVDSFTINLTTEKKRYNIKINTPRGGTYCIVPRYARDYYNPICQTLRLVNVSIPKVEYTVEDGTVIVSANVTVDYPCRINIGLFYNDGTLITSGTFSLSPDAVKEVRFVVELDKVKDRVVCVAPVGVDDVTATYWKLIL